MIVIIDSGGANLASVIFAIERLGKPYQLTKDADIIQKASHVILPGVSTANTVMNALKQAELPDCIRSLTQPVIGLCVGMQILFDWSAEGDTGMLGIIPGRLRKFDSGQMTVPHMGWNNVQPLKDSLLLKGLDQEPYFYFVHSYYAPVGDYTAAQTGYGHNFTSIVEHNNFFGCQFHPERSGENGARLLKNFVEL